MYIIKKTTQYLFLNFKLLFQNDNLNFSILFDSGLMKNISKYTCIFFKNTSLNVDIKRIE